MCISLVKVVNWSITGWISPKKRAFQQQLCRRRLQKASIVDVALVLSLDALAMSRLSTTRSKMYQAVWYCSLTDYSVVVIEVSLQYGCQATCLNLQAGSLLSTRTSREVHALAHLDPHQSLLAMLRCAFLLVSSCLVLATVCPFEDSPVPALLTDGPIGVVCSLLISELVEPILNLVDWWSYATLCLTIPDLCWKQHFV